MHDFRAAQSIVAADPGANFVSPPGAALYAGALWWRELLAALRGEGWTGRAYLDCGGSAAHAVEALHLGLCHLVLAGDHPMFSDIAALLVRSGGELLAGPALLGVAAPGGLD